MSELKTTPRAWHVAATVVVTVAGIGYFSGTRASDYVPRGAVPAPSGSGVAAAPRYLDLRGMTRGPNANLYEGAFDVLRQGLPSPLEAVAVTDEERERTITARRERRAFDGAPPVVPHRVRQDAAPDCLTCHERGAKIADRVAPMMSHRQYASCTQCHVEQQGERFRTVDDFTPPNEFVSYRAESRGSRAWEGAPPTIPHPTQMRENCNSCHGVAGPHGLRTPHADRQSCTQCHAPAAMLDRRPTESFPPWVRPGER